MLTKTEDKALGTYEYTDGDYKGFLVDITEDGAYDNRKIYHAWIYHGALGVKSLMFGIFKDDAEKNGKEEGMTPLEYFEDLVYWNMEDHIRMYIDEYMQEDLDVLERHGMI